MTFGQQLKAWREAANLTQDELIELAKPLSIPYLSNLERDYSANTRSGKPRASAGLCERLAKALKVPVDDVLLAAGHAPKGDGNLNIDISKDVRLTLLKRDVSPEDKEEYERAVKIAVRMAEERIAEKRKV